MKTTAEIRYENLCSIIEKWGDGNLTKALEKTKSWQLHASESKLSRKTLDQLWKKTPTALGTPRGIGDDLARKLESEFGLERGWLDHDHSPNSAPKHDRGLSSVEKIEFFALMELATGDAAEVLRTAFDAAKDLIPPEERVNIGSRIRLLKSNGKL